MRTRQPVDNRSIHGIRLQVDETVSLAAQRGTVVRCHAGRVWITHEGDAQDYTVPSGAHFRCASAGRVVVSALTGEACVTIHRAATRPEGAWTRNGVHVDAEFVERARAAARREMVDCFARLAAAAWRRLRAAFAWRDARGAPLTAILPLREGTAAVVGGKKERLCP